MHQLPAPVARHREAVLDQVLGHLPDELLSALALGLERHAGRLVAGQLYDAHDGGGCAVGVMLRELTPSVYRTGRLRFEVRRHRHRHRSVLTERTDFDHRLVTRLSHVEMCFDRTAVSLTEHTGEANLPAAANATGRWMAEACRRRLQTRNRGFFVPSDWRRGPAHPGPAHLRPAHLEPAHPGPEGPRPAHPRALTGMRRLTGHDGLVRSVVVPTPDSHVVGLPV